VLELADAMDKSLDHIFEVMIYVEDYDEPCRGRVVDGEFGGITQHIGAFLPTQHKVPIIIAINKVDKPEADIERTKRMLITQGLVLEDVGGDVQSVAVSALKGIGLEELIDTINTQAALLDLRADSKGPVEATVIESRSDSYRGYFQYLILTPLNNC